MSDSPGGGAPGAGGGRASYAVATSTLARALRAVGRLAALWLAARSFSVAEVGSFAFWLAAGTMTGVLCDLGLAEHLMRAIPGLGAPRGDLLRASLRLRLLASLAVGAPAAVAVALVGGGDWGAFGAFLFGLGTGLADFLAAARRSLGRFDVEAAESGLAATGGLVPAALVAPLGSFTAFQLALGLGTTSVVLFRLAAFGREIAEPGPHRAGPPMREVLSASRWLWLKALVGLSFLDATTLLLGVLSGPAQVALFAGASRLVGVMTQPLIALNWVFTPALAHEARLGGERLRAGVRRLNLVGLVAVPAGVAVCVAAGGLALASVPGEYRAASAVLLLLALGFAVHLCALNAAPLVVLGADRALVVTSLAGLATVLATTAVLAPARGALGAAAGVVAGLAVNKLLTLALYLRHRLPLGGWRQLVLALAVSAWSVAVWATSGHLRETVLATGGLLGGAAILALLHRTRLFGRGDGPPRGDTGSPAC